MVRLPCTGLLSTGLLIAAGLAAATSCSKNDEAAAAMTGDDAATAAVVTPATRLADADVAPFRIELLDLAHEAVGKFPIKIHLKNRSRAQEKVVAAALQLEQPTRALAFANEIANWRKGAALADLAFYAASHGAHEQATSYVESASLMAGSMGSEITDQQWRKDAVLSRVGRAWVALGNQRKADSYGQGLVDDEAFRVMATRAELAEDADAAYALLGEVDEVLKGESMDLTRAAVEVCVVLYRRFYADAERRRELEKVITASFKQMPVEIGVRRWIELAGIALAHDDTETCLRLVGEATELLESVRWYPDTEVPFRARLAALRYRAGEEEVGREQLDRAVDLFDANLKLIHEIYQADALRPVAESYQAIGDTEAALKIYRRAVEVGALNPNSRPRAEDLAETCCSMSLNGVEPDANLRTRLLQIANALGEPW